MTGLGPMDEQLHQQLMSHGMLDAACVTPHVYVLLLRSSGVTPGQFAASCLHSWHFYLTGRLRVSLS